MTPHALKQDSSHKIIKKDDSRYIYVIQEIHEKILRVNRMVHYFWQYTFKNVFSMMINNLRKPKICTDDFPNRLVVITGATAGIGHQTARKYASHGANLLTINRNEEKSKKICKEIQDEFGVECNYEIADFKRLSDVKRVGQDLLDSNLEVDVFIHNAGVFSTGTEFTGDGNELVFQVNHLAAFMLNYMLKEKFKTQGKARIIYVNSEGHRFCLWGLKIHDLKYENHRYTGLGSYGNAKTAQLLTMIKFAEIFDDSGVTINAMHPGDVKSNMGQNNGRLYKWHKKYFIDPFAKSPEISAEALYYLGVSKEVEGINGKFFNLTKEEEPAPPARDKEVAEELWDICIDLVGLKEQNEP